MILCMLYNRMHLVRLGRDNVHLRLSHQIQSRQRDRSSLCSTFWNTLRRKSAICICPRQSTLEQWVCCSGRRHLLNLWPEESIPRLAAGIRRRRYCPRDIRALCPERAWWWEIWPLPCWDDDNVGIDLLCGWWTTVKDRDETKMSDFLIRASVCVFYYIIIIKIMRL